VLVAIQYSVLAVRSGYTRTAVVQRVACLIVICGVCTGCLNPVNSAKLELVDKFCYLRDMLSVDGHADAAVEARIRISWNKFRRLVPLLTNMDVSLITRGRLYSGCVCDSMLHGSET